MGSGIEILHQGLSKGYDKYISEKQRNYLKNISLNPFIDKVFMLHGQSGSGKTFNTIII